MPKYRLMADYGWVGTTVDNGEYVFSNEEEAHKAAHEAAMERVDYWVELVEDGEQDE